MLILDREHELIDAVRAADADAIPFVVLGGGSNVVIADEGVDCLVLKVATGGQRHRRNPGGADLQLAAGEVWDEVVLSAVAQGLAGIECLSGIPGLVGAAPIQNIGAYGQQIADCLLSVRAYDRKQQSVVVLSADQCGFAYRQSIFKGSQRGRYVVLDVTLRLRYGNPNPPRYLELAQLLRTNSGAASLHDVREAVMALRQKKSMLVDPGDANSRSVGSFFVNPVVDPETADRVRARAEASGVLQRDEPMPRFDADGKRIKLAAAWLIERAGFHRGYGRGSIGLSQAHALALVNRGGGSSRDLLSLAREIQDAVRQRFGLSLVPEPTFLGFGDQLAGLGSP